MAMAATMNEWQGRVLGASKMVNIPVRNSFIIAGTKIKASGEVARRLVPIRLATKGDPKKGRKFTHDNLEKWAKDNRPALVAAALTIIQAWVARGMKPWTEPRGWRPMSPTPPSWEAS